MTCVVIMLTESRVCTDGILSSFIMWDAVSTYCFGIHVQYIHVRSISRVSIPTSVPSPTNSGTRVQVQNTR